jgi:hypothetical protein
MLTQAKYGNVNIHVTECNSDRVPCIINETEVIANPVNYNGNNTRKHGIGHRSDTYDITGFCSPTELVSLEDFKLAKTYNTLKIYVNGVEVISKSCLIKNLTWTVNSGDKLIRVNISFLGA